MDITLAICAVLGLVSGFTAAALQLANRRVKRLQAELKQTRMQLAACGVAAIGYPTGINAITRSDYNWSASFGEVIRLRARLDLTTQRLDVTTQVLGVVWQEAEKLAAVFGRDEALDAALEGAAAIIYPHTNARPH